MIYIFIAENQYEMLIWSVIYLACIEVNWNDDDANTVSRPLSYTFYKLHSQQGNKNQV
jgi:hypothetical protein